MTAAFLHLLVYLIYYIDPTWTDNEQDIKVSYSHDPPDAFFWEVDTHTPPTADLVSSCWNDPLLAR
jgi:hypothetical protein